MTINEIIESGMLELYAIDALEPSEKEMVSKALDSSKKLRRELKEIELALKVVAKARGIAPSSNLKKNILAALASRGTETVNGAEGNNDNQAPEQVSQIKSTTLEKTPKAQKKSLNFMYPFLLALAGILGLGIFGLNKSSELEKLRVRSEKDKITCDSIATDAEEKSRLLDIITERATTMLPVDPTDKYPNTSFFIHNNPVTKKNLIQLKEMPNLASDQSYQLWSLKDGADPIPLNVFDNSTDLIEVDFIEGTNAYAVTIEKKEGAAAPDLNNLIGVVPTS